MAEFLSSYHDPLIVICASVVLLAFVIGFMRVYKAVFSYIKSFKDKF